MRLLFLMLWALPALAAAAATPAPAPKKSELQTDVRFTGSELGGKYRVPGEAMATVENEKSLIDLIQPRREFKDRLRKSVSQR